jgi:5-exo-hydroxycamphor dehydrogenase
MSTGRAAVLVEPNRIETWDVPIVDPGPGEVLVSVVVGGVCGSDLHIKTGDAGVMPFPIILGHEGVGRIERLGDGVSADYASNPVEVGDLVCWSPIALCGRCYSCTVLEETPCENSQFFEHAERPNWASYSDYAWLPRDLAFYRLPDGAQPDAVAALGCALPTALRGFEQAGPVRADETVVVQGAGPVGLAAVLVAAVSGAREIIVIDQVPKRLEVATKLGATAGLSLTDLTQAERRKQVYDRVGPNGPDVVVEAAGALPAFPEGVDLTGNHGRYIILGLWGQIGLASIEPRELTIKNMKIKGATFPKPKHYYGAMQLSARLQDSHALGDLVTHRFAVGDADAALRAVASGEAIKAVIDPAIEAMTDRPVANGNRLAADAQQKEHA